MELFKKILKITVVCLFTSINAQCGKSKFQNVGGPVTLPPQTSPSPASLEECKFYKAQSLILNCKAQYNFFTEKIQERKNTITSICLKQAFLSVWGANFNPSPYIYDPEGTQNTNFHWHFGFGNIQKGSPTVFPPNSLELRYANLLNQFNSSLDTNRMNQCLGGNYPFDGPTIINTGEQMINLELLEPETFMSCYREQLEIYRAKKTCPL